MPETIPVVEPTLASELSLLAHTPPGLGSVRVVVNPVQTDTAPGGLIAAGLALTVTVATVKHAAIA